MKNGWPIDDIIYPKDNATLKAVITALVSRGGASQRVKERLKQGDL